MSLTEQNIVGGCPTYPDLLSECKEIRRHAPETSELDVYKRLAARFRKQCSKKKISTKWRDGPAHAEWLLFVQSILPDTDQHHQHQASADDAAEESASPLVAPTTSTSPDLILEDAAHPAHSRRTFPSQPARPQPNRLPLSVVVSSRPSTFSPSDAYQNKDDEMVVEDEMVLVRRHRQEGDTKMTLDEGDTLTDLSSAPGDEEEDVYDVDELKAATKSDIFKLNHKLDRLMVLVDNMQLPTCRGKDENIKSKPALDTTSSTSFPSPPAPLASLPATTVDQSFRLASLLSLPASHTTTPLSCVSDVADYSSDRAMLSTKQMVSGSCNVAVHSILRPPSPPLPLPLSLPSPRFLPSDVTTGTTQASRKTPRVELSFTSSSHQPPPGKKQRCDDLACSSTDARTNSNDICLYNSADAVIADNPSAKEQASHPSSPTIGRNDVLAITADSCDVDECILPGLCASSTHSSTTLPVDKTLVDDHQLGLPWSICKKLFASIKWTVDWRALSRISDECEMDDEAISDVLVRCSWLSAQQKKEIRSLLIDDPSTATKETLASALVAIHSPLTPDAVDERALKQLMSMLDLLLPLARRHSEIYAQSIRQEHIQAIAERMSCCSYDAEALHDFLQYVNLLTSFRQWHTNMMEWVEKAWPIEVTLCFVQHHHTERDTVVEGLLLISVHAEYMRQERQQELVDKYSSQSDTLNTMYEWYKEDSVIRQLLDEIVQPMQRWSKFCRQTRNSTSIFCNTAQAVLEVLDASTLDTRRRVEDDLRRRINGGNKDYFSPAVRGCLVSEVLRICGQAGYCRDTTHHAIDIVDTHFSNALEPIDVNNEDCQQTLVACVLLAVRLETSVVGKDSPVLTDLMLCAQVNITLYEVEKIGWRIYLERFLALPSKPMFWLLQIMYRVLATVQTDEERTRQLLHMRSFGRVGQIIDIMMLYVSELPYRLMAAVAFHIVYNSFIDVSEKILTEVTGYSLTDVKAVANVIVAGRKNVSPYYLQVDTAREGDYMDVAMTQPKYNPKTHLHPYVVAPVPAGDWYMQQPGEPAEHLDTWQPQTLNKKEKRVFLGKGSYGKVFVATRAGTDNKYAVKVATIKAINSAALREINILRFARRFRLLHICQLAHVDATLDNPRDVRLWLLLYRRNLAARLSAKEKSPPTPAQIRCLLKQLLIGVCGLHSAGFIHRDLKPQNILLGPPSSGDTDTQDEQLAIADFGLSRIMSWLNHNLTGDVATLHYVAVEVLFDHLNYTSAFDMWSVGCIFAEMITRKQLFCGNNSDELKVNICRNLGVPLPSQTAVGTFPELLHVDTNPQAFLREQCKTLPVEEREHAADLLRLLLQVDYTKRIRAKDALLHPYFLQHLAVVPAATAPSQLPVAVQDVDRNYGASQNPVHQPSDVKAKEEQNDSRASVVTMSKRPQGWDSGRATKTAKKARKPLTASAGKRKLVAELDNLAQQIVKKPLKPQAWLTDVHICFGMHWLNYHSCNSANSNRAICFDSYVIKKRARSRSINDHSVIHPFRSTVNSLTARLQLFPLNVRDTHWILAVHDVEHDRLYVLDSYCSKMGEEVQSLRQLLGIQSQAIALLTTPLQNNSYDCGCWVIAFATAIVHTPDWTPLETDDSLFTQLNVEGARERLQHLAGAKLSKETRPPTAAIAATQRSQQLHVG